MKTQSTTRNRRRWIAATTIVALTTFGFCILTNVAGDYRLYFNTDIPFVYQLNETTPDEYIGPIEAGHREWNDVPSSFWEFTRGENTTADGPSFDGVNLVFFDLEGINFGPPPSNVIAFSQTFTSNSGGYHAIESDLIWNARDFPPSPSGELGQQDLQSVIAHELGHHLGLGHQGPFGGPPGCGVTILEAVMYGFSMNGDTSSRHLHIHDIGGVSAIYPSWILEGTVTNLSSGQPIADANITYVGTNSLSIGPVETPGGGTYERPGDVFTEELSGPTGMYGNIVLDQTFDIVIDAFGFIPDTATIGFDPPGGIGVTQTITHDVALQVAPNATFSGVVRDATTLTAVVGRLDFYGTNDPEGLSLSVDTQPDGSFSAAIPALEIYRIVVNPVAPYVDTVSVEDVLLPLAGLTMDFHVQKANVLIVDDDGGSTYEAAYQGSFDRLGVRRRTFSVADSGTTPAGTLATFDDAPHLLWFTGNETTNPLTDDERQTIIDHLENGGEAIITGQNIAEYSVAGDALIEDYLGIQFDGNSTGAIIRGFPEEFIGQGGQYLVVGGAGNQSSKDYFSIVSGSVGVPTRTLFIAGAPGDSSLVTGVRVLGPGASWGVAYFGFGLEGFSAALMDTFVLRSMNFFNVLVSVDEQAAIGVPEVFTLEQNYPNPFNPSTRIVYALPIASKVTISIFDVTGRLIARAFEGDKEAGVHSIVWNGKNSNGNQVASGLYLYKLEASAKEGGTVVLSRKMLLIR